MSIFLFRILRLVISAVVAAPFLTAATPHARADTTADCGRFFLKYNPKTGTKECVNKRRDRRVTQSEIDRRTRAVRRLLRSAGVILGRNQVSEEDRRRAREILSEVRQRLREIQRKSAELRRQQQQRTQALKSEQDQRLREQQELSRRLEQEQRELTRQLIAQQRQQTRNLIRQNQRAFRGRRGAAGTTTPTQRAP